MSEGYSPSITGGWSRADVVIADEAIDYPLVSKLDVLVAMYQGGLESNLKLLKRAGVVVAESELVDATGLKIDGPAYAIPAVSQARTLGKKMLANIVLLGALIELTSVVSRQAVEKTLVERFPAYAELNVKALDSGFALAKDARVEVVHARS